jgi:hypothetical protein
MACTVRLATLRMLADTLGMVNGKMLIHPCHVSNNTRHWYIAIVPYGSNPGRSSDIDFYTAPVTPECQRIPPAIGWVNAPHGQEPSPMLSFRRTKDDVNGDSRVSTQQRQHQQRT